MSTMFALSTGIFIKIAVSAMTIYWSLPSICLSVMCILGVVKQTEKFFISMFYKIKLINDFEFVWFVGEWYDDI